jgi:hypothetical protein
MARLKLEGSAVTPKQWALLGVLGAALVGAMYWPSDDVAGDAATGESNTVGGAGSGPRGPRIRPPAAQSAAKQWPKVDLTAALAHDPFASPLFAPKAEAPAAATAEDTAADLLALRQDGVSMIVRDGDGVVATVGERKLRVGDVIDGYRVVAIEMDGVVLERVAANQDRGE